jgi:regulator of replication initiation timing
VYQIDPFAMKPSHTISILAITFASCTHSGKHDHHASDSTSIESPNQVLYDQVMDIHDEIMPRVEDIYQLKKELKEKIASATDLASDKKLELEQIIAQLDSADNSMMDWMHSFNPLPDSIDQEKARAYLESEMEKIKKVKALMTETIARAKEVASKK